MIFLACAGLLAALIYLFARIGGQGFFEVFQFPKVKPSVPIKPSVPKSAAALSRSQLPLLACLVLLGATGLMMFHVSARQEDVPGRARFVTFPTALGSWQGRPLLMEPQVEHGLGLEDYILSDYSKPDTGVVNFYVAYYASQRSGSSPHSPIVCIPGGGWQITKFERTNFRDEGLNTAFPYNRVVIERDGIKQLVYYWFVQRGRKVANEYWSKWYLFTDAIIKNRTDGALVRLSTPVNRLETEHDADRRLQSFIRDLEPSLGQFLPGEAPVKSAVAQHQSPS